MLLQIYFIPLCFNCFSQWVDTIFDLALFKNYKFWFAISKMVLPHCVGFASNWFHVHIVTFLKSELSKFSLFCVIIIFVCFLLFCQIVIYFAIYVSFMIRLSFFFVFETGELKLQWKPIMMEMILILIYWWLNWLISIIKFEKLNCYID